MKIIYNAKDINEAHIIAGLLHANNIDAHVGGHYLQGGVGELAAMDFATVYVADEDIKAAQAIIVEYESRNKYPPVTSSKRSSPFIAPLIIILMCLVMMLLLAMFFKDY